MMLTKATLFAGLIAAVSLFSGNAHAEQLTVCHGYSCHFKTRLTLGAGDMRQMASILRSGHGSPAAERRAVSRLVQFYSR